MTLENRMLRGTLAALCLSIAGPALAAGTDIPAARVVLPWSDFQSLYEKGMAPEKPPEVAPHDFTLSRVQLSGEADGESALFTAKVRIDVLKEHGWIRVPVLPGQVALRRARIGGRDASLLFDGSWYQLVTDQKGAIDLELEFAVSTFESAGEHGFSFPLPRASALEVELAVPAEDLLAFDVAGAQQVVTSERQGDRVMKALLPARGNLAVTWSKAQDQPDAEGPEATAEARVYAEHQALIGVSEGVLTGSSTIHYSILHAGVDTLRFGLPADVTLLDVQGKGVGEWEITTKGERKLVEVALNFEAQGSYALQVEYERALPEGGGEVLLPDLQVVGVERVKGWVGVDARSNLEIAAGTAQQARVVDVRELPPAILGQTDWPVLLGFTYRKPGWSIPLEVRQHAEVDMLVTIIDQVAATTVLTPDGRRMTQVTWAMRNNRAQYLRIDMPEAAVPWSAFVGGKAVKPARADDGKVMIPLARSQTSGGDLARFAVELVYVEDGASPDRSGAGSFDAQLPVADVPATAVAWTVYVPREAKIPRRSIGGSLRPVDAYTPIDLGGVSLPEATRQVQRQAQLQFDSEATAGGVQPVRVTLPVDGRPLYFEKLLVLDERLEVQFDYRRVGRR